MKIMSLSSNDAIEQRASTGWLLKWNTNNVWVKAPGFTTRYIWDSYAEIIASAVAKDLGITRCIKYNPCVLTIDNQLNVLATLSNNFNKNGYKEVTFEKLMHLGILNGKYKGYDGCTRIIKDIKQSTNLNITQYINDILVLDYIICNTDRNLWNMSLMYDSEHNVWVECPIYDNGNSLGLYTYSTLDNDDAFDMSLVYGNGIQAKPFDYYFENQVNYIKNLGKYKHREMINTKKCITEIKKDFTTLNNKYNVVNCLDMQQLNFVIKGIEYRVAQLNKM